MIGTTRDLFFVPRTSILTSTGRAPARVHAVPRWLAIAVLCAATAACSASSTPEAAAADPKPSAPHEDGVVHVKDASKQFIEVEEVTGTKSGTVVSAPARVDFRDGAVSQVGAPLDGRVAAVHAPIGQHVKVGDPLVTLDCPEAASMRAAAAVAQASLREARIELERQRRMQQEGVGIERDVVATETRVSSAEAELARVEAGAATIGSGTASSVVVRAPIAGVVLGRKASVGLTVQRGGDPLVEIGDSSSLWVVADVFERDLPRVRPGAIAHIDFQSLDGAREARVASIGTVVASGLRTAPVFMTLDAKGLSLRPGMYGRAEIAAPDAGITLPTSAVLIKDGKDPVVYIQKDPLTFVRRRVVVAQPVEGRVQIVSGLAPGEKVVVRGALLLDGSSDQLL